MKLPEKHIHQLIDSLTRSRFGFALYRLPWTDECYFVMQTSDEVETLTDIAKLNGKKGFVIAPFLQSDEHPLLLIRPDITAYDWKEISQSLITFKSTNDIPVCKHPEGVPVRSLDDEERYMRYAMAFGRFIEPLQKKKFKKLVLSRPAFFPLKEGFSPLETFIKACNDYPRMMIYLCYTPVSGIWIGSTPEVLLSGQGQSWSTVALAGTMPINPEEKKHEWSQKNKEEQALVADYVREIVKKYGRKMLEKGPYEARAGQLLHLKTDYHFQLKDTTSLGDLLQELHPTPAVCGLPKQEAYQFIAENEGYDRRYYTGFVGWLDPEGTSDVYVNLRCMEIRPNDVKLYAGGGILSSSEVQSEWEETGEKMKTMKNILT